MSSTITTIQTQLYSILSTTFPTKSELADPYDVENNDDFMLKNGFGIEMGAASNSYEGGSANILTRTFTFPLTSEVFDLDRSSASRKLIEKSLFEDEITMLKALSSFNLSKEVANVEFLNDNGIVKVTTDKSNYLVLRVAVEIAYIEFL